MVLCSTLPVRRLKVLARAVLVLVTLCILGMLLVHLPMSTNSLRSEYGIRLEEELSQEILSWEAVVQPELGADGWSAKLEGAARELGKQALLKRAVDTELSRRIPLNRTIREVRHHLCAHETYRRELPSASVVIAFHDEPLSLLLRTVVSVLRGLRHSPVAKKSQKYGVLKEVLLVDDGSPSGSESDRLLAHYVRTRLPNLVWIKRLPSRLGITGARAAGASDASGDVLVFLDAQCEVASDWLRPLLARVAHSTSTVAVPVIDTIDADTFKYNVLDDGTFSVGGFTFNGQFSWSFMTLDEQRRHQVSPTAPARSPTMVGGVFAMQRAYFWSLGGYDRMGLWGGENLEMSFRVWQCGGSIEVVPCSRVGHVVLGFHPNLRDEWKIQAMNVARTAEVWMDDYNEIFYFYFPGLRPNASDPELMSRKRLRRQLNCRPFHWYLGNVYPHKFVPLRDDAAYGKFENVADNVCLTVSLVASGGYRLAVKSCSPAPLMHLSVRQELRDEMRCAAPDSERSEPDSVDGAEVIMQDCEVEPGDRWEWLQSGQLKHVTSGLCLTAKARLARCLHVPSQSWGLQYSTRNGFAANVTAPTQRELRLRRLRDKWRNLQEKHMNQHYGRHRRRATSAGAH